MDVEYEDGFVLSIYDAHRRGRSRAHHAAAFRAGLAYLQRPAGVCQTGYEREKRGISESGYAVIE